MPQNTIREPNTIYGVSNRRGGVLSPIRESDIIDSNNNLFRWNSDLQTYERVRPEPILYQTPPQPNSNRTLIRTALAQGGIGEATVIHDFNDSYTYFLSGNIIVKRLWLEYVRNYNEIHKLKSEIHELNKTEIIYNIKDKVFNFIKFTLFPFKYNEKYKIKSRNIKYTIKTIYNTDKKRKSFD